MYEKAIARTHEARARVESGKAHHPSLRGKGQARNECERARDRTAYPAYRAAIFPAASATAARRGTGSITSACAPNDSTQYTISS